MSCFVACYFLFSMSNKSNSVRFFKKSEWKMVQKVISLPIEHNIINIAPKRHVLTFDKKKQLKEFIKLVTCLVGKTQYSTSDF